MRSGCTGSSAKCAKCARFGQMCPASETKRKTQWLTTIVIHTKNSRTRGIYRSPTPTTGQFGIPTFDIYVGTCSVSPRLARESCSTDTGRTLTGL
ncbi:hypothetical protein AG1IA_01884 [Rhizoctonia solani AG-1 IA]|uniref:Uncharacterized protein n=1 Tax=Thanatephorus cucumeris (strain AG1-IA) TaxID=983506 RepID=L8X4X4_THACA|nr:hypothetical protein AG1IA_01884 [Rhizoctonia solani AG-1 IA]